MTSRERIEAACNHRQPVKLAVDFGGGFVYCAIHNLQALTPLKNLLVRFDVFREYR